MRSTLTRPLAALVAGAALTLGSAGVAIAEPVTNPLLGEELPTVLPHAPEYNDPANWTQWLTEYGFVGVDCFKDDAPTDPWIVPVYPSDDEAWILAVVKGGAGDTANELYWEPVPGEELSHAEFGNSHVILCSAETEDEGGEEPTPTETETDAPAPTETETGTPAPTTTTGATGPVVETDIPAGGNGGQVALVAGLGALLAAAGALVLNRRREASQH